MHLQRHAKNSGVVDERLQIQWPRAGRAIWKAFNEMGRQYSMAGPLPLSCTEIESWQRLYRVELTAWEIEMIRVFDSLRLDAAEKQRPKQTPKGRKP